MTAGTTDVDLHAKTVTTMTVHLPEATSYWDASALASALAGAAADFDGSDVQIYPDTPATPAEAGVVAVERVHDREHDADSGGYHCVCCTALAQKLVAHPCRTVLAARGGGGA